MTRLPRLKGKDIVRILERLDFRVVRTRGSHTFLRHPDGRATVVPAHSGETIGPGLLRAILRDIEMPIDEFIRNS
jgi:predicted RNA binding protein YcfA (HicA-like mRNA interferase family)